jgi:hypothetical protein
MAGKSRAPGIVSVPSKSKRTPLIFPDPGIGILKFTTCFSFQALFLFALLAEFPDDALHSELAVAAGFCACLTVVEAFPAISYFHFVAFHGSVPLRMITAFHGSYPVVLCLRFELQVSRLSA